ncbi:MAG TPA: ketopantoate reductase C-terminal domain-containing protein, partial [Ilumatobacteraceae bacterium]|nr:ketopantoate reductase C-terminal domain-containing protein [Ilumatobacteraceae bacterium]
AGADVERVVAAWRRGGFDTHPAADVRAMQWEKLICNVAYSAPCALTGMTVGEVRDDKHLGAVSRAAATEAWQTARALNVPIAVDDPVAFARDFAAAMPAAKPSLLLDIEARRASEIEFINGAVPREAAKCDLAAPVNATLTALVKAREASW